jgi:hypothetical protein
MIAFVVAVLLGTATPDATACHAADISVTDLRIKVIKASGAVTADRLLITGDFSNVGDLDQEPHLMQHAELLRNGVVIAAQTLPALAAGVTYPLQFRIFRETTQRTDPIQVLVRYVLDDRRAPSRNNCLVVNDSLQKLF